MHDEFSVLTHISQTHNEIAFLERIRKQLLNTLKHKTNNYYEKSTYVTAILVFCRVLLRANEHIYRVVFMQKARRTWKAAEIHLNSFACVAKRLFRTREKKRKTQQQDNGKRDVTEKCHVHWRLVSRYINCLRLEVADSVGVFFCFLCFATGPALEWESQLEFLWKFN